MNELPMWKTAVGGVSAVLVGLLFVVAGVWKLTEPYTAATLMMQARVWPAFGLICAIGFGTAETFAGSMLFFPRFRRWGGWLTAALLVIFMGYIGINYSTLRGAECNCFPWLKRTIGPGFFAGDGAMLLLAVLAAIWARRAENLRGAAILLSSIIIFAATSFGITYSHQTGLKAPDSITVDGQPYSLQSGKIFLFFFDPECSHCEEAAKRMSHFNWKDTQVIAIPTRMPRFGPDFLKDTKLKAKLSNDLEFLKKTFSFVAGPYGVALENGRQKQAFINFDEKEPKEGLRQLGFID
jgi:hypothetical protein